MGPVKKQAIKKDNWVRLLKRKKAAFQLEVHLSKRIKKVTTVEISVEIGVASCLTPLTLEMCKSIKGLL